MEQTDFEIGPDYVTAPEFMVKPGVPVGAVHAFMMDSHDSRIYPGIRRIENEITCRRDAHGNRIAAAAHEQQMAAPYVRTVWVYVPAGYVRGTTAPFMVVQDGYAYMRQIQTAIDNLIAAKRIPPLVVAFVDNGGGDAQGSQRGLEYDTVSGVYGDFIETEVLPLVEERCGVTLSRDPEQRAAMGASSGAACAFTMAWFHPDRYRKVLSYSGTFVNQQSPPNAETPRGAWEYHATILPAAKRKPIRIWMEVGEKDLHHDDPEETWHNWPLANRRMAAVLKAKGYDYRFTFSRGARHVDPRVLEQTFPDAMAWLWR
ncbi:MAG: esterase family protein [Alphaproteobacteria bacterium]|nr:esterase family protein [Alphaproteobacteria bacterium]